MQLSVGIEQHISKTKQSLNWKNIAQSIFFTSFHRFYRKSEQLTCSLSPSRGRSWNYLFLKAPLKLIRLGFRTYTFVAFICVCVILKEKGASYCFLFWSLSCVVCQRYSTVEQFSPDCRLASLIYCLRVLQTILLLSFFFTLFLLLPRTSIC